MASTDEMATAEQVKPPRLHWLARIVIALAFLELLSVDPLNANSASAQRSEDAVMRLAAPFYDASREVTVVLIDDRYLERSGSGWPMTYREQGLLLRRLLSYEPTALFVDLLYRHRHGRDESRADSPLDLLRALPPPRGERPPALLFAALSRDAPKVAGRPFCYDGAPPGDARRAPAPSLIDAASIDESLHGAFGVATMPAGSASDPPGSETSRPEPLSRETLARAERGLALVGWSGCGTRYPLMLAADRASPTPAMAMFRAHCARRERSGKCADLGNERAFIPPMIVRWGAFPSDLQTPFYAASVCQRPTDAGGEVGVWRRLERWARQFFLGAVADLRQSPDPEYSLPCPAVTVIRADQLLDGDEDYVRALLQNKALFLGARVSGIPDWYTSPVHGRVPGVVLHAMALDNLLAYGDAYTRRMPGDFADWLKRALAVAVALLAPWLIARGPWLSEPLRARIGLGAWCLFALALAIAGLTAQAYAALAAGIAFDLFKPLDTLRYAGLLLAMALLALLALMLGWSPWNWIGLVIVMAATVETMKTFLKSSTPKPFPHPQSLVRAMWRRGASMLPAAWRFSP